MSNMSASCVEVEEDYTEFWDLLVPKRPEPKKVKPEVAKVEVTMAASSIPTRQREVQVDSMLQELIPGLRRGNFYILEAGQGLVGRNLAVADLAYIDEINARLPPGVVVTSIVVESEGMQVVDGRTVHRRVEIVRFDHGPEARHVIEVVEGVIVNETWEALPAVPRLGMRYEDGA